MRKIGTSIAIAAALMTVENALAADTEKEWPPVEREALEHWKDLRFGMFIHWGPVSLTGREIGWSRGRETPVEEYDSLYKRFNPIGFNADEWVRTAKAAGMKYLVITAKHHDGFCLWPSEYTDYDITATPFKRDVVGELAEACRKHGLEFGIYYSVLDWWHPDYPLGPAHGRTNKPDPDMESYVQYMHNQTEELINNYGPLLTMWFDGEWEKPWTREMGNKLYVDLRRAQPSLLINNRVSKGRHGMAGTTKDAHLNAGDYDTPEQRLGTFNRERPWETCMTICRQWAWKPNDNMKSRKECVQTLLKTIGGDGNLLFNVGPMPDGRIEPRQVERLKEMGEWVKAHAAGIYGTRGGPFMPGEWGASTCKGNRIYLYVMNWDADGSLSLPAIDAKIEKIRLVNGGKVDWEQKDDGISISVPADDRHEIATAIELIVDGDALEIEPVAVLAKPSGSVAFGRLATASNVFQGNTGQYGPAKAFDDNVETRWATDAGTEQAWIEVDLGEPKKVGRVYIDEAFPGRIQSFKLQCRRDDEWVDVIQGEKIGQGFRREFNTVEAQRFRLLIERASDGPTINEIQLFTAD